MSGKCGFTRAPQSQTNFEDSQKLAPSNCVEKDKQAAQKASQNNVSICRRQ